MNIFIGADHRGVNYKAKITSVLSELWHTVVDMGAYDSKISYDYPKYAYKVGIAVSKEKNARGILVCMSGIGQTIAANKVRGVRAALCYNASAAALSRQHNDANVLVLSSKFVKQKNLKRILKVWLSAQFEGGRHARRVKQIEKIERGVKLK